MRLSYFMLGMSAIAISIFANTANGAANGAAGPKGGYDDPKVSGSKEGNKKVVCHCPGKSSKCVTLTIAPSALQEHLSHGDTEGACGTSVLRFDVNSDGKEDLEDLIFIFRAIDDPIHEVVVGDPAADVNKDGVVDMQDAIDAIIHLTDLLGEEALGGLTPTYFDDEDNFPWDQSSLEERRLFIEDDSETISSPKVPAFLRSLQSNTCGVSSSLTYAKGTGSDPIISWDTKNCLPVRNLFIRMNIFQKLRAIALWIVYRRLLTYASFVPSLSDAVRAYSNYRANTGRELIVSYEKAIAEDSGISSQVDLEMDSVKRAIQTMFNGQENAFDFYSTDSRLVPSPTTQNWQKALGGHRIWSAGKVQYDPSSCSLNIDYKIKMEDFYNFNPGQSDIASGLPDKHNCLFAKLGWARPFYSRGSITRKDTIKLQCCKDEDCGAASAFDCTCNLCTAQCPTQQRSGGQGFTSFTVELFKTQGTFEVFYQMYSIPDELNIYYEGATVFSTNGLVSGSITTPVTYGSSSSTSTIVTVEINAPQAGTAWDVSVSCPP